MILLYDGVCGFCKKCVSLLRLLVADAVQFGAYQDYVDQYPYLNQKQLAAKVHLVSADHVWVGAAAVYKVLSFSKWGSWLWVLYLRLPGFRHLSEWGYRMVAANRYFVSSLLFPSSFHYTVSLFFKGLGWVYVLAFGSLLAQIEGLYGSQGILPISILMNYLSQNEGSFWMLPTLFWLSDSDGMILSLPVLGICFGVLMVIAQRYIRFWVFLAWVLYLSIVNSGRVFMSFQWDILLLEVGFLAILLSFFSSSRSIRFLFRWLLFRVMLASGLVKLMSQDITWRDLTALTYHYWTQPLPHIGSWIVHQLPVFFHKVSVVVMFVIELVLPFFIFGNRWCRYGVFLGVNGLMGVVILTGNYGFFNVLVMVMTLFLLDDRDWQWLKARYTWIRLNGHFNESQRSYHWVGAVLGVVIFLLTFSADVNRFLPASYRVTVLDSLYLSLRPFHLVHGYGLFAVMTQDRPELLFQGSNDGQVWENYLFKWKPTDVTRWPNWAFPYHPRLDWQLWFAGMRSYEQSQWLVGLLQGLSQNRAEVLRLLAYNPFQHRPPRYLRIMRANYVFTDVPTLFRTGKWWDYDKLVLYSPVFQLRE